jgi:hypothetical protein
MILDFQEEDVLITTVAFKMGHMPKTFRYQHESTESGSGP